MARAVKQNPTLYLGLFVVFFALYAREHQRNSAGVLAPALVKEPMKDERLAPASRRMQDLTKTLQEDSLFQVRADGLTAIYRFDSVVISFSGDEVFSEGHFAFRETWYTALDHLAELIKPYVQRGLKIEVVGYTDAGSSKERQPSDYGNSDYALSFARAEWVARFLERRSLIPIKERVKLTGAGAVKAGRKVDLKFSFDHN